MFDYLFEKLNLPKQLNVKDKEGNIKEVDFTTPRKRIDFTKGIEEASGIDITKYGMEDADKLRADIQAKGIEFEKMDAMGTTTLIDYLYKKVLRPNILGPAFIYNYPVIMQPLARISDNKKTSTNKQKLQKEEMKKRQQEMMISLPLWNTVCRHNQDSVWD